MLYIFNPYFFSKFTQLSMRLLYLTSSKIYKQFEYKLILINTNFILKKNFKSYYVK